MASKGKKSTTGRRRKRAARELEDYLDWYAFGGDTPSPSQRRKKRKNPTKAQRRASARTAAKKRGLAKAVRDLVKRTNPTAKISGAKVVKLKGGALRITPIKANRGRR